MEYVWYGIAGVLGGVLGGMGMGGGTVLIPLLTIFYSVSQHTSQAVNLVSFIPMAVVALIIHLKNKLIDFSRVLWIIIPGVLTCIIGCYIARAMSGELLKRCFGGFLLILSVFQAITELKKGKN
ncbi:MAG: sulfite exporter TauE/SafE family protein [Clostridiales bacterium]|nr:sulfite exporter TauE/SafE family protein [Clostridiales bacterium]